ncbi:DUF5068 domain-containing protein [Metabacillus litoralis]|uniref:DUF5068 domain-containing protein n=1 Tax=Metabacillus litoralis TaxID=152268 RepID=UPI00203A4ADF|nr:DUF5068 domain-containing protein [Metabacillus litoralis]
MRKTKVLTAAILSTAMLLLAACGNEKEASGTPEKDSKQTVEETAKPDESSKKDEAEESSSSNSSEVLNPNIAEETEGNVEVIYTNNEPNYAYDFDGFKVSVDEYQIVKVTDMNTDFYIEFDDQTEGYVITAKVTIDNTTDKALYYSPNFTIQLTNVSDYIPTDRSFVREEYPKSQKETETSKWAAGEKITGLVSFTLTNEQFESLKAVKPKFIIGGGVADNDQFSGSNHEKGIFDFIYNDEQSKQVASESNLYPDKLTTDNLADKKMIFEKLGINETQQLGDVKVTLEGVQYTEVIPTEANKERFSNFGDNGIVALTVKLKLDNQSDALISIRDIGSKVTIDKDRGNVLAQGMVEPVDPREIQAGEIGEKFHVFLFRKDEFEIYKKFDLEFGPLDGEDGKSLFKGKTVTFTLPR